MNSSNILSGPTEPHNLPPCQNKASRTTFSLDGPSAIIDPRTQAVRRDLADIRLADVVFAPHYASPLAMVVKQPASLRVGPEAAAQSIADLPAGSAFEALDFAGGSAWGIAVGLGLVGYVDRTAIAFAAAKG